MKTFTEYCLKRVSGEDKGTYVGPMAGIESSPKKALTKSTPEEIRKYKETYDRKFDEKTEIVPLTTTIGDPIK